MVMQISMKLYTSDLVGVMNEGKMRGRDPDDLIREPATSFVAKFVGQRNILAVYYRWRPLRGGTNNLISHSCLFVKIVLLHQIRPLLFLDVSNY